eukprot:PhF_6_TR20375/c0_g2_i1/m.29355
MPVPGILFDSDITPPARTMVPGTSRSEPPFKVPQQGAKPHNGRPNLDEVHTPPQPSSQNLLRTRNLLEVHIPSSAASSSPISPSQQSNGSNYISHSGPSPLQQHHQPQQRPSSSSASRPPLPQHQSHMAFTRNATTLQNHSSTLQLND